MQIFQAPKINQIAPNKRTHRWEEIHGVASPFPGEPGADEFGFWFNYFWAEARLKPALTEAEKSKLCELFFSVLQGTGGAYTPIPDLVSKEDSFKESILRQVLLIGFKRVAIERPRMAAYKSAGGRKLAPPPLEAVDAATLNWESAVILSQTDKMHIGYRSDTRSYEDLVKCKGFNARARQDGWVHTAYAFNQRWNPFYNPVYSESLFLRLGSTNRDACLQTVVSSGANFRDVVHFPILNDYGNNFKARSSTGEFLAVKPPELWTAADIQMAAADRMKVRAVDSKGQPSVDEVDHVEKDNHIHVFHATGLRGFNTAKHFGGADAFPERSMEGIPLANLLADIHFIQKWWYNPAERQIVFYEVEFNPIKWVPSEQAVEKLLGPKGKQDLKNIIDNEIMKAKNRGQDLVPNGSAYKKYQIDKQRLLSALEKKQVYEALQKYIDPIRKSKAGKYPPNGKLEKTAVASELPKLKSKIDATTTLEWSDLRTEAIRLLDA